MRPGAAKADGGLSDEACDFCRAALMMVEYDVDLVLARQYGVTQYVSPRVLKEIVGRWPDYEAMAGVEPDGSLVLSVAPIRAQEFVRSLARAVMH